MKSSRRRKPKNTTTRREARHRDFEAAQARRSPFYEVRNNLACGNNSFAFRGNRQMTRQKNRQARERGFSTFAAWVATILSRASVGGRDYLRSRGIW